MRDWFDRVIDGIDEINGRPLMQWRGWMFIAPFVGGLTAAVVASLIVGMLDWAYILPVSGGLMAGWFAWMLIAHAWNRSRG